MSTRAEIRSLARIKADQTNSTFPTDVEYNLLIDEAGRSVWRKLIKLGWNPSRSSTVITANGASIYNVAANTHIVVAVHRVEGTTRTRLPLIKPEEWETYLSMSNGPAMAYEVTNGVTGQLSILFYPRPTSGSYEVWFQETFPGFANDASTWAGPQGSADLIAVGAAIQGLQKEGADTRELKDEFAEKYAEVCEDAGLLNSQNPATVRDVRNPSSIDMLKSGFDWQASEGWY